MLNLCYGISNGLKYCKSSESGAEEEHTKKGDNNVNMVGLLVCGDEI